MPLNLTLPLSVELLARASRQASMADSGMDATGPVVFWLHIGTFAVYNALFS